jgi:hypothetical protein
MWDDILDKRDEYPSRNVFANEKQRHNTGPARGKKRACDECFPDLPNVDVQATKPRLDIDDSHRALVALRLASDKCGNECMKAIASAVSKVQKSVGTKRKHKTLNAAYNDSQLGGGGYKRLKQMHIKLRFCTNPKHTHGEFECQRRQPFNHKGPKCFYCGFEDTETVDGFSIDHAIDLKQYYPVIFETTDLAQRIVDYHELTLKRLSNGRPCNPLDPDLDSSARVHCVQV